MIINTKVIINTHIEAVWNYFSDPKNLPLWIRGLESYHHITGEYGKEGSKGIFKFREYGKLVEMREEVIASKEQEEHTGRFHHRKFDMIINFCFFDEGNNTTTMICNTEYRFRSLITQLFSKFILKSRLQERQNENIKSFKKALEPVAEIDLII